MTLPMTMKALRVKKSVASGFSLGIEEVPVPTPNYGEVLIKLSATTVQPSDILNSKGSFAKLHGQNVFGTSGPDFSFTVDGAQAEYAVVPIDAVVKLPSTITAAEAANMGTPWSAALMCLSRADANKGDTVMVLGATGSVGSAAMQIAQSKGCVTIGVGRHGTDINSVSDPSLSKAKELTGGRGSDVVLDTVGDLDLILASINVLADGGRLSTIAAPRSGTTQLSLDIFDFYRRNLQLIGCNTVLVPQAESAGMFKDLLPALEAGTLKPAAESTLMKLTLDNALDAYNGKTKHAVIVFA